MSSISYTCSKNISHTRERNTILCLLLPLYCKFLLPAGLEELLKIEIFGVPVFLPYLLLLIFLRRGHKNTNVQFDGTKRIFNRLLWLQMAISFVSWLCADYDIFHHYAFVFVFLSYFLCMYIGINYRFSEIQINYIRKYSTWVLIAVMLEMLLVAFNIVNFGVSQADGLEVYGSVTRVQTSMGDTNNGGIALFMFGVIVLYLNRTNKIFLPLLVAWIATCSLTVTKSVFLALIAISLFAANKIRKSKSISWSTKIKYLFSAIIIVAAMFYIGAFNPVIERFVQQYAAEELASGRDDLINDVLNKMSTTEKIVGSGIGSVYPTEELQFKKDFRTKYSGAPHNSYVLKFAEVGYIGVICFIIFLLFIIWKNRRGHYLLYAALLCMVGIFFNTETVPSVYTEHQITFAILLILIGQSVYEKDTI